MSERLSVSIPCIFHPRHPELACAKGKCSNFDKLWQTAEDVRTAFELEGQGGDANGIIQGVREMLEAKIGSGEISENVCKPTKFHH